MVHLDAAVAASKSCQPAFLEHQSVHPVSSVDVSVPIAKSIIKVTAYYPRGLRGPLPVIVYSTNISGSRHDADETLMRQWGAHGFAVVYVVHNDPNVFGGGEADTAVAVVRSAGNAGLWASRASEMDAVIDALPRGKFVTPDGAIKFDLAHLGLAGFGFGAQTAMIVGGATVTGKGWPQHAEGYRRHAIALFSVNAAGVGYLGFTKHSWAAVAEPSLMVTGQNDEAPFTGGKDATGLPDAFTLSPPGNKFALRLTHAGWYATMENVDPWYDEPSLPYVVDTSIAFWEAYLKKNDAARSYLRSHELDACSHGQATLSAR